jgi:protein involved in polysaccharide export with SLBB domain
LEFVLQDTDTRPFWRRLSTLAWMACTAPVWLLGACSSIPVDHLPGAEKLALVDTPEALEPVYLIRTGDDLDFKFIYTPELNDSQKVRPDGFVTLPLIDEVKAAGRSPKELGQEITQHLTGKVKTPSVAVIVRSFSGNRAYVGGEVATPQVLNLEGGVSALQAIYRAGGVRTGAHLESVVLIRKGPDGKPTPYHLDLGDAATSQGQRDLRVALQASDVIYVPRSPIANANKFVQQYVVDLLLFRGISFGYSVTEIHGNNASTSTVSP